jgi:hypothetical protein
VCTPGTTIDFSDRVPPEFGHGAVATIDGRGFRNGALPAMKPRDEYWVGLFGSSVAFGVPATDNEATIAAALERELSRRRPDRKRVRVVNFSIPAGQQPQQFLVFTMYRHLVDGIVTFDGHSEVIVPACYNHGHQPFFFPYFPYYQQLYGGGQHDAQMFEALMMRHDVEVFHRRPKWQQRLLGRRHARQLADRRARLEAVETDGFRSMFHDEWSLDANRAVELGVANWSAYTALMHDLCCSQHIDALFVIHPAPERGKPLCQTERIYLEQQPEMVALRTEGYERVRASAMSLGKDGRPVVDFADVFAECGQPIYTDATHFEDRGATIVAAQLAGHICERWPGFRS